MMPICCWFMIVNLKKLGSKLFPQFNFLTYKQEERILRIDWVHRQFCLVVTLSHISTSVVKWETFCLWSSSLDKRFLKSKPWSFYQFSQCFVYPFRMWLRALNGLLCRSVSPSKWELHDPKWRCRLAAFVFHSVHPSIMICLGEKMLMESGQLS